MREDDKIIIKRFEVELKSDVIPTDMLPYLPCLTDDDREVIQCKQDREGPRAAVPILLDRLKKRSGGFEQLLTALEHTGCAHLKEKLENAKPVLPPLVSTTERQEMGENPAAGATHYPETEETVTSPTTETTCPLQSQLSCPSQETEYYEYDMFVCYSPKDSQAAIDLREVMTKVYNLRVCIDLVDFVPGKATCDNVCDCIRRSTTIVFLLSPHFLEKMWATWEMKNALYDFQKSHGSTQPKRIVPVVLKECRIPNELKSNWPINATDPSPARRMEAWKRLAAAVRGERVSETSLIRKLTSLMKLTK